jgi:hypothetical protein
LHWRQAVIPCRPPSLGLIANLPGHSRHQRANRLASIAILCVQTRPQGMPRLFISPDKDSRQRRSRINLIVTQHNSR